MIQFSDLKAAALHLRDHVLTPYESHAWYEVWAREITFLDSSAISIDMCFRLRNRIREDANAVQTDESVHSAFQRYLHSIDAQISESELLGWQVVNQQTQASMDTNGIFSVSEKESSRRVVITAFLPGFGSTEAVRQSSRDPDDPHGRVGRSSWMRGDHSKQERNRQASTRERAKDRFQDGWSTDERIYYLVFRPVVQFVRGFQQGEKKYSVGLVDLKTVLPKLSQLKLENWLELRNKKGACR